MERKPARGGTELMMERILNGCDPDLLGKVQIIPSRVRELEPGKKHVLWMHDLPEDPEMARLGEPAFQNQFNAMVFVSHWQMHRANLIKGVPFSRSVVLENAIMPIEVTPKDKEGDTIRFIYHTTPHRGLELLVPVFERLCEKHDNITLEVYSSFSIYGWDERDAPYEAVFERCRQHPKITYHGAVSNDEVREALKKAHIFAFPSIWPETSCLALIEAMSAGLLCVHPNLAALPETAGGLTRMYQFNEDRQAHAMILYRYLDALLGSGNMLNENYLFNFQKSVTDFRFNIAARTREWDHLLEMITGAPSPSAE